MIFRWTQSVGRYNNYDFTIIIMFNFNMEMLQCDEVYTSQVTGFMIRLHSKCVQFSKTCDFSHTIDFLSFVLVHEL